MASSALSDFDCRLFRAVLSTGIHFERSISTHREQSRNSMLGLVLSAYIRSVTISDSQEVKQPAVIDPGSK